MKPLKTSLAGIACAITLLPATILAQPSHTVFSYNGNTSTCEQLDHPWGMTSQNDHMVKDNVSGNFIVAGVTGSCNFPNNWDYLVAKYDFCHQLKWTKTFNGSGNGDDMIADLAVDASGNIYVTGKTYISSGQTDFHTIKYSPTGTVLWQHTFNKYDIDEARAISVDPNGNVYVTGNSVGPVNRGITTVKYSSAGVMLWNDTYSISNSEIYGNDIVTDASGNSYITGSVFQGSPSDGDIITYKYSTAGALIWSHRYISPNSGISQGLVIKFYAPSNLLYVGGFEPGNTVVMMFDALGTPSLPIMAWVRKQPGTVIHDLAISSTGNVHATGATYVLGQESNYLTLKYNDVGTLLWSATYNGANFSDVASAIVVDASENVYITGSSMRAAGDADFVNIKYNSLGTQQWAHRYGTAGASQYGVDIVLHGNSVAAGGNMNTDITIIDYNTALIDCDDVPEGKRSLDDDKKETATGDHAIILYPQPSNGVFTIRNNSGMGIKKVVVYDVAGRLVFETMPVAGKEITISELAGKQGMYIVELLMDDNSISKKKMLIE